MVRDRKMNIGHYLPKSSVLAFTLPGWDSCRNGQGQKDEDTGHYLPKSSVLAFTLPGNVNGTMQEWSGTERWILVITYQNHQY